MSTRQHVAAASWAGTLAHSPSATYPGLVGGDTWTVGTPLRLPQEKASGLRIKKSLRISLSLGTAALSLSLVAGAMLGSASLSAEDRAIDHMLRVQAGEVPMAQVAVAQESEGGMFGLSSRELLRRFVAFDRAY